MEKDLNPPFDFHLLDKIRDEAGRAFSEPASNLQSETEKDWLAIAKARLVTQNTFVALPDNVIKIQGLSILNRGSISVVKGKKKAGKTTLAAWLVAQNLTNIKVLWIDMEQGLYYASRTQAWVLQMAGVEKSDNLETYDFRDYSKADRLILIEALLADKVYDLVVLDGVRDLIPDINNTVDSTNLADLLGSWAQTFDLHIIGLIHENKGTTDSRGHIGSELENKAEAILQVASSNEQLIIKHDGTRGEPFEPFALGRDNEGIPYLLEDWKLSQNKGGTGSAKPKRNPEDYSDQEHLKTLELVYSDDYNDKGFTSGEFYKKLAIAWRTTVGGKMDDNIGKKFRTYYQKKGFLIVLEKQAGNRTINKLNKNIVTRQSVS